LKMEGDHGALGGVPDSRTYRHLLVMRSFMYFQRQGINYRPFSPPPPPAPNPFWFVPESIRRFPVGFGGGREGAIYLFTLRPQHVPEVPLAPLPSLFITKPTPPPPPPPLLCPGQQQSYRERKTTAYQSPVLSPLGGLGWWVCVAL
jgi:hypothetical protein